MKNGYTLIETIVVLCVVVILGFLVYPKQKRKKNRKMRESVYNTVYAIKKNLEIYYFDSNRKFYPETGNVKELLDLINIEKETGDEFLKNINLSNTYYESNGSAYTIQINPKNSRNVYFSTTSDTSEVKKSNNKIK
ncbi:MAG: hypothetical protein FXF47_08565 [Candidatus Mcinerneyibacterium aminivorans]|uniref:Type II secretion system protein n=1 Tax=Candidatus Mcinerneyibacterium aminivorans TaxID=2703815 RepID=A0A5D0MJ20_9BACT|nr:MAG: hypothetical protein FXF47_08565 [Candidatus Mcinerneyibacterium aminivorans]